eukprot:CAMPEP_0174257034 /NCGR_PEP_ID=MMETSP0439-20130205/6209_1 /TAXON_ID=0 /ORGANISM="Stereomyxa ramosa, Strain Chinc5" /LENGTH=835 /DNA_ID=CAMNT_0015339937 /DNA_START=48 /DNA_END=2552 /DNA_ORIENTATION=+
MTTSQLSSAVHQQLAIFQLEKETEDYICGVLPECESPESLSEFLESLLDLNSSDSGKNESVSTLSEISTKLLKVYEEHKASGKHQQGKGVKLLDQPITMNSKTQTTTHNQTDQQNGEGDDEGDAPQKKGRGGRRRGRNRAPRTSQNSNDDQKDQPNEEGLEDDPNPLKNGCGGGRKKGRSRAPNPQKKRKDFEKRKEQEDKIAAEWGRGTRNRGPNGMVSEINLVNIDMCIEGVTFLQSAALKLYPSHRYGIVGKNGCGKTTLLQHINNRSIYGFPSYYSTALLAQELDVEPPVSPSSSSFRSNLDYVIQSFTSRAAFFKEEEARLTKLLETSTSQEDSQEACDLLDQLFEKMESLSNEDLAREKGKSILKGLGFSSGMMDAHMSTLSGGWRMRLELAQILFLEPDVMLLDEPTNHLDLKAVLWLQEFLAKELSDESILVVVSHDRVFLNAVTTWTIHFHHKQLFYYPGNYDAFVQAREENLLKMDRLQEKLDAKRDHLQKSIENIQKAAARQSRKGKQKSNGMQGVISARKKKYQRVGLEKTADGKKWNCQEHGYRLGSINAAGFSTVGGRGTRNAIAVNEAREKPFEFSFVAAPPLRTSAPLVQLLDVSFSYSPAPLEPSSAAQTQTTDTNSEPSPKTTDGKTGGKMLFSNLDICIEQGSHIALLGLNGSGKTTLLNLIVGNLEPTSGQVKLANNLRIAYFAQHHADQLDGNLSAVQHIINSCPSEMKEHEARAHLGKFGLGKIGNHLISTFSGGQKSRVVFATILLLDPHLLILDEPSNHLDNVTIEALVKALNEFEGSVILVSHDQYLVKSVAKTFYVVDSGDVKVFDGEW